MQEREEELEQLRAELREGKRERERLKSQLQESKRTQEQLGLELKEAEQIHQLLRPSHQEDEQKREQLKSENERLRAERDALEQEVTAYDRRRILKQELNAAHRDGLYLRGRTSSHRRRAGRGRVPTDEAAAKWAIRTSELIKEALGEGEARGFLGVSGQSLGDPSVSEEQKLLNERLYRLSELIRRVDSLQHPVELRPDFVKSSAAPDSAGD
jgi:chromosome segregation ATPase